MSKEYRKSNGLASIKEVDLSELERLAAEEHPLDLVARAGAQMLLEAAIQAEVEAALGRGRYERLRADQRGYRNGVRTRRLTSGIGELEVDVPRVSGTSEPFISEVLPSYTRILPGLVGILPALYAEGLSTRDGKSLGKAGLSKSSISRACQKLAADFEADRRKSLADLDLLYLFLDGFYVGVRKRSKEKEGILVAHGYLADGSRVVIGVELSLQGIDGLLEELSPGVGEARASRAEAGCLGWEPRTASGGWRGMAGGGDSAVHSAQRYETFWSGFPRHTGMR